MPLDAGRRLGAFEVVSPLGAGGMGEVYRARDTHLSRDVAIKVLPEAFASDADRLARFEREARVLASLGHPNIAAIHGFEESEGVRFLVMELVAGETLAERLQRGLLPLDEALGLGRQLAEALEDAHNKGVVHRDLKPANIKVTPEGRVKVLDFGLAKAFAQDTAPDPSMEHSPTLTKHGTSEGVILGTAAYMSPEQARGKPLDKRTDIWSFGCVLFEAIAGTRIFAGETTSDTLAAVLTKEPEWKALPDATPAIVRSLLRRCLQKDRDRRLHDIADARIEIEEARAGTGDALAMAAPPRRRASIAVWLTGFFFGAAVAAFAVWYDMRPAPAAAWFPKRLDLDLVSPADEATGFTSMALSPDGTKLAYIGGPGLHPQVYVRSLSQLDATPVAGTEEGNTVFFSPDGQWLGFIAGGKLKKVPVGGGEPVTVADSANIWGGSWGPDGTILFGSRDSLGLSRVSAAGGAPQVLTTPERRSDFHSGPHFLPGGRAALFSVAPATTRTEDRAIGVVSLETGRWRVLVKGGTDPRYAASGHLLYLSGHTLMAAPFDLERLELTGPGQPVLQDVSTSTYSIDAMGFYDVSEAGSLVFLPGGARLQRNATLFWVNRQGKATPLSRSERPYLYPTLSPDGRRLAVQVGWGMPQDIWASDLARDTWTRLTSEGGNGEPVWSPDGTHIVFDSNRGGTVWNLFWMPADGSGSAEPLTHGDIALEASSFSPDGKVIVFYGSAAPGSTSDIQLLPLDGTRQQRPLLATPFQEGDPMFSPDGHWLAYVSDESGRNEVYVRPYPGPGGKWLVSSGGGAEPVWARSGRELFYRSGARMMVATVQTGGGFSTGLPQVLFEGSFAASPGYRSNFDVSLDGTRFVMIRRSGEPATPRLVYIPDFFDELRARLRTGLGK